MTNWEPYLFVAEDYGSYTNHFKHHTQNTSRTINPQLLISHGFASFFDVKIVPQVFFNKKDGTRSQRFGDFPVILGFQALRDDPHGWRPDLRVTVAEVFPTGQYNKLNPKKNGTDASGGGSFVTRFATNFQKLFAMNSDHWLRLRLNLNMGYSAPVRVRGFNTYGGGFGTEGKVYPGFTFQGIFAFEYTMTQNWVLALDLQNITAAKTRFSGKKGVDSAGNRANIGQGAAIQWSLAPGIEYNFNSRLGIISGVWWSLYGRNSEDFLTYVIALNYLH